MPRKRRQIGNKLASTCVELVAHINRPNVLVERVCNHLGASASVLWLRDPFSQDAFKAFAHYGRPDIEARERPPKFRLRDPDIAANYALTHYKPIFGQVGQAPFDGKWPDKEYTKYIVSSNLNHICLYPIYDSNLENFGIISLYSKNEFNRSRLIEDMRALSQIIYYAVANVHGAIKELTTEHRKIGHEIAASVQNLKNSLSKVASYIRQQEPSASPQIVAIEDIEKSVTVIQSSAKTEKMSRRIKELALEARSIPFREHYNSAIQPLIKKQPSARVILSPLRINGEIYIIFHPVLLGQLLDNLATNAIKYSKYGGIIRPSISVDRDERVIFNMSNISSGIPDDERQFIWDANFRGKSAVDAGIEGHGLGLNVVRDICEGCGVKYDYKETAGARNIIWSNFILTFPQDLVDWSRT